MWLFAAGMLPLTMQRVTAQPQFQQQETRQLYLEREGLADTAFEVESALVDLMNKKAGYLPAPRRAQMATYFSFVLTLSGLNAQDLQMLDAEGLDILHAISSDNRPLVEQSLLADLVVTGTVLGHKKITNAAGDAFTDVSIKVDDVFKGILPETTITIRQRNGLEFGENPREAAQLTEGKTYLLLLSNSMFRYGMSSRVAENDLALIVEEEALPSYFSIYRHYEMAGDRVLWSGYNKRKTRKALKDVRWLDGLLQ